MKTYNDDIGRIYVTPKGNYYSVTTMLGATSDRTWLEEWKERVGEEEANQRMHIGASFGELFHQFCQNYLEGNPLPKTSNFIVIQSFNNAKSFLDKHVTKLIGCEVPLYSETLQLAGRADAIVEWDGVNTVLDFKLLSDIFPADEHLDYMLQATCYAMMIKERMNMICKQNVIFMMPRGGRTPQIDKRPNHVFFGELARRIKLFRKQIEERNVSH